MSEQYPSRLAEKIMVRLPDGMRDRLNAAAKKNGRSANAEVVLALQHWFDMDERHERDPIPDDAFKALNDAMSKVIEGNPVFAAWVRRIEKSVSSKE